MTEWICIDDQLPEEDALYLIYAPSADPEKPFIHTAWHSPNFGWSLLPLVWCNAITHWMPLPEPPRGTD